MKAVAGGEVINAAEYAETQDFAAGIARPVAFPRIDLPGCYPKAQGLLRALFLWYGMSGKRNTVAP